MAAPELHAFIQLQHLTLVRDGQPRPAETGFVLRRARAAIEGSAYSELFTYRAELELAPGGAAPLDLFVAFKPAPRWSLRVGQMRVPFSRNWTTNEAKMSFSERSIATDEFRYDYDVGILATATFIDERLAATLGVLNGAGRNALGNDNVDPLFVARVAGTLGARAEHAEGDLAVTRPPSLTLGAAATLDYVPVPDAYGFSSGVPAAPTPISARDTNGNGRPDGVRVFQVAGDLGLRWRGLAVDAEVYFRRESWAGIGGGQPPDARFAPHARYGGAFAQATYYVPGAHLEAGARVATAEISPLAIGGRKRPPTACEDAGGMPFPCALPFTDRRSEVTLLVVGHWFGRGVAVTGMYSALRWKTDAQQLLPWSREQRFLVQTQLAF